MSISNATETSLLEYVFTNTAPAWNAATQLDIHLHVADPGEAGTSATSPATYTGYAPVTVSRAGSAWTVTGDTCTNDNLIQFPQCTAGTNTISHLSITPNGSTTILLSGALNSSLAVSAGIQPQIAAGDLDVVLA